MRGEERSVLYNLRMSRLLERMRGVGLRSSVKIPRLVLFSSLLLWSSVAASDAPGPAAPLPPLPQGEGFERIEVAGYLSAVVAWPAQRSASRPLPILVATHGSYDQPEWNCETYHRVVAGRAVVLCPRGRLRWDTPQEPSMRRYFFPSTGNGAALGREVDAAVRALREQAGNRVAEGTVLYAGFSQGAILGAPLLISEPARYPRALLVEGGHGAWNQNSARSYARGGGQRILFACGRESCTKSARAAAAHLERAGVKVKIVAAEGEGHTYDGRVANEIATALPWLLEGDARFTTP